MTSPEKNRSRPVLVSACLLGARCRYDGSDWKDEAVELGLQGRTVLAVCPEVEAGFGVPRPTIRLEASAERVLLTGRGVVNSRGEDVTTPLVSACRRIVDGAVAAGCREAILKERSPSCGVHEVWFGDELIEGEGVLAALARREGIRVKSEEDAG